MSTNIIDFDFSLLYLYFVFVLINVLSTTFPGLFIENGTTALTSPDLQHFSSIISKIFLKTVFCPDLQMLFNPCINESLATYTLYSSSLELSVNSFDSMLISSVVNI